MKKTLITTVSAVALCGAISFAAPASANVTLTGGNPEQQPDDLSSNQLFPVLYSQSKVNGYRFGIDLDLLSLPTYFVGGALELSEQSLVTFEYLGSEAKLNNQFLLGGNVLKTTPGITGAGDIPGSPQLLGGGPFLLGSGVIDFSFLSTNGTAYGENGGAIGDFCFDCSIFITFLNSDKKPTTNKNGWVVDIFFDDGHQDDNHDDVGIRMTVTAVPVPAAIWIIGAALGGFGVAGYRSRRPNA